MAQPSRGFKLGAIVWALGIGVVIVILAGSVILPSTKRARIDLDELRQRSQTADAAPSTNQEIVPTTSPIADK